MAYLVQLPGWTPPERFAPETEPWTQARIYYSATPSSLGSPIGTPITLTPAYTDPAAPPTYNFSTDQAPAPTGWFSVEWIDSQARVQLAGPVELPAVSVWAPSVGDVASRVALFTREAGGGLALTFTDRTVPTASMVQAMIGNDFPLMLIRTGDLALLQCPTADDIRHAVRSIVAERVALQVMEMYRPEDTADGRLGIEARRTALAAETNEVVSAAAECLTGAVIPGGVDVGDTGGGTSTPGVSPPPKWRFGREPLIGMRTRW